MRSPMWAYPISAIRRSMACSPCRTRAAGKKVRVVEDVVQVVEVAAHLVTVVERPRGAISREEVGREAANELCHLHVGFRISYINRRIEDRGGDALDRGGIAIPQVAMEQRLLRLVV